MSDAENDDTRNAPDATAGTASDAQHTKRVGGGAADPSNVDAARDGADEPAMTPGSDKKVPADRLHGTPGGSLGALNETDPGLHNAQESEKGAPL